MRVAAAMKTSSGALPAPAPMPANEASTRWQPCSTATTEFATPSDKLWCAWMPISVALSRPKLRLFGQVILGLMWGFGGGGWFGADYAAMVRGMVASMRSKARRWWGGG